MNTNLASYIMGMVIDENDHFYFVQKDGQTYALDKAEGPHKVGESVKGFAYTDMKQKLRLTTLEVTATQESFGWGTVTEVRKDLGLSLIHIFVLWDSLLLTNCNNPICPQYT